MDNHSLHHSLPSEVEEHEQILRENSLEDRMITRKQYKNGEATHEDYYDQFVNEITMSIVLSNFSIERLRKGLNGPNIPIEEWDKIAPWLKRGEMEKRGDYLTLAGSNCILKAAARRLLNNDG